MSEKSKTKSKKVKVTISIDKKTWQKFLIASIVKHGKVKHASSTIEELLKNYLKTQNLEVE